MQIKIFDAGTLIGCAILSRFDPPQGIAVGDFAPTEYYQRNQHANVVDGDYLGDKGDALTYWCEFYKKVNLQTLCIEDFGDLGISLWVTFEDAEGFREAFPHARD